MLINPIAETPDTSMFEFDTREDAVKVATRMIRDGYDVRINGTVIMAEVPFYVYTMLAHAEGLDY